MLRGFLRQWGSKQQAKKPRKNQRKTYYVLNADSYDHESINVANICYNVSRYG